MAKVDIPKMMEVSTMGTGLTNKKRDLVFNCMPTEINLKVISEMEDSMEKVNLLGLTVNLNREIGRMGS